MTNRQPSLTLTYTPSRLGDVLDALDDIHTAVSDGTLAQLATVSTGDLREWLHEILYLASQTLIELDGGHDAEIRTNTEKAAPALRLVRKSS
ncbi:MAG: hypothetical protein NZM00_03930 [Anaerolinea sp.]|nr:hypothetical protein [Anaerolinea sp.]